MEKTELEFLNEIEETTKKFFLHAYESVTTNPKAWLSNAKSLKLGASIFKPHFDTELPTNRSEKTEGFKTSLGPIYLLLVGFSIENYAKAVSIKFDPNVTENGKLKRLKRHDLLGLLSDIDFILSSEEEELVERLEQFVLWAGRYPVPTNAKNVSPKKRRHPGLGDFLIYSTNKDSELCSSLLDRLDERAEAEIKSLD